MFFTGIKINFAPGKEVKDMSITLKDYEGFRYIDGGVCASEGFTANGINAGINPDKTKNDLGVVFSRVPCDTAAVYTQNKVKGAPVYVTKEHLKKSGGISQAVLVNSKNANTCNDNGVEIAEKSTGLLAEKLGIDKNLVIDASTGVIGQRLSLEPFSTHMDELVDGLSKDGNGRAVNAIMTTDTVPKEAAVEFELGGKTVHLGGMAKGSGMIHPNMATTLTFITSDISIDHSILQKALDDIVKVTYNCLTIDGDTSTNDMLTVMAGGLAGNPRITEENDDYRKVREALRIVMTALVKMLAKDGEGATKLIEVQVKNAPSQDTAIKVAKSVAGSTLFKCAIFGEDANWGRILCAIGYTDADFDINTIDVDLGSQGKYIAVCRNGAGVDFSEDEAAQILKNDEITVLINMNQGKADGCAWGCDLTHDYITINGDYRS